jgi:hypothetical protein
VPPHSSQTEIQDAAVPSHDQHASEQSAAPHLPPPSEPMLAERGDWAADFNQAQITCFKGSMSACDAIWLSKRVLLDTFLYNYGRTCGGRVSLGEHAAPELSA